MLSILVDLLQIDILLFNLVNRSRETTQACKNGRSSSIRLRCDPSVTVKNYISLPRYNEKPAFSLKLVYSLNCNKSQSVWFHYVNLCFFLRTKRTTVLFYTLFCTFKFGVFSFYKF